MTMALVAWIALAQDAPKASPEFRSKSDGFTMAYPAKLKHWAWSASDPGKGPPATCKRADADVKIEVYAQPFDSKAYAFYDAEKFTKSYEEGARRDYKTVKNKGIDTIRFGTDKESARRLVLHVGREKEVEHVIEYYCFQSSRNRMLYTVAVTAGAGLIDGDAKEARALRKEVDAILASFKSAPLPKKP